MERSGAELSILVFASRDSVHAAEAQVLAKAVGARYVDRLAGSIEELLLVATHKVTEPVAIVVLHRGQVVARFPRLVTRDQLERDLHGIT